MVIPLSDIEIVALESGVEIGDNGLMVEAEIQYYINSIPPVETENAEQKHRRMRLVAAQVADAAVARLQTQDSRVRPLTDRARYLRQAVGRARSGLAGTGLLPPGGGAGIDQLARDAAATAQGEIDTHEAADNPHGIVVESEDQTARDAAAAAQAELDAHEAMANAHHAPPAAGVNSGQVMNLITAHNESAESHDRVDSRLDAHVANHPGGIGGADQVARAAAAAAQMTADDAEADANTNRINLLTHNASQPHGFDQAARNSANAAAVAAATAQGEIDAHEVATHNTDATARASAAVAQAEIDAHEAADNPHGITGGGGTTPTPPVAFGSRIMTANLANGDVTAQATTGTQIMQLAEADIDFNVGDFVVTTENSLSSVAVPVAGKYQVSASLDSTPGGANRYYLRLVLAVTRGANTTYYYGTAVYRRGGGLTNIVSCSGSWLLDLEAGDSLTINLANARENTALWSVTSSTSQFGIVLAAGVTGIGGGTGQSAAQVAAAIALHDAIADAHHSPGGAVTSEAIAPFIKDFAEEGNAAKPLPVDLAPNPVSGRVLGMRTAGGQLELSWNQLSAGSPHFVLDTIPTPEQQAIGGLLPQGGVVLVRETTNHPTQLWVRISPAFALVLFHTFGDPLVMPGADGMLPAALDNLGRIGIAGNHFYRAVGEQGTGKLVGWRDYGPTRTTPPPRQPDEILFAGSFANPPTGNYTLNALAWDRGSQVWIRNQVHNGAAWVTTFGPSDYHQGRIYQTNGDAAVHVANATEIGDIYIIGHGNAQRPRVVTSYTAPAAPHAEWIPVGVTLADISELIGSHDTNTTAHAHIRGLIGPAIVTHDTAGDAHADVRALITALESAQGITISAFSSGVQYSLGDFVTHVQGLYVYTSNTPRTQNNDPGQFPGYWFRIDEGMTYYVMGAGAHRIAARTLVVFANTDEVYLCTTTQTTPRDQSYIRTQAASLGGTFINLGLRGSVAATQILAAITVLPREKLPPVREWVLNADYKKGEIVDTTGEDHLHFIALVDNDSKSIANVKRPGTPGGMGVWDQLYTVDNPPPASGGGGGNFVAAQITTGSATSSTLANAGLSVTITPSSATAKILVTLIGGDWFVSGNGTGAELDIQTADNDQVALGNYSNSNTDRTGGTVALQGIHTPGAVTPQTYRVRWRRSGSDSTIQASGPFPLVLSAREIP